MIKKPAQTVYVLSRFKFSSCTHWHQLACQLNTNHCMSSSLKWLKKKVRWFQDEMGVSIPLSTLIYMTFSRKEKWYAPLYWECHPIPTSKIWADMSFSYSKSSGGLSSVAPSPAGTDPAWTERAMLCPIPGRPPPPSLSPRPPALPSDSIYSSVYSHFRRLELLMKKKKKIGKF